MTDFPARICSMSIDDMWRASRRRTGLCHSCGAQLQVTEDHTLCDVCWDLMIPVELEED